MIFLSYRRADSAAITGRIFDRLEQRYGRESVFMDFDAIPPGADFRAVIDDAVAKCGVLIAVIGLDWLTTRDGRRRLDDPADFVRIEIESALGRKTPVVPILVGEAGMPSPINLPPSLAELPFRNAVRVDTGRDFHPHVDRLIRGLDAILGTSEDSSPRPAPTPPPAPLRSSAVVLIDGSLDPHDSPYEQTVVDGRKVIRPKKGDR